MTKIKDLATVTVDNAFRSFPLDKERYELLAALESWYCSCTDVRELLTTCPTLAVNKNVYVWFVSTSENLLNASIAFKRVVAEPEGLPSIVYDRARRVSAVITACYDDLVLDPLELLDEPVESIVDVMWRCIIGRMHTTQGFAPPPDERADQLWLAFLQGRASVNKSTKDMELQS